MLGNRAVDSREVARHWHNEQATPVAGLCPVLAYHPLFLSIFGKVPALIFNDENATIGEHRHKVRVKAATRELKPEGVWLSIHVTHPIANCPAFVEEYSASEFLAFGFQITDYWKIVPVEFPRALVWLIVRIALFIKQQREFCAGLERLRVSREEGVEAPFFARLPE